MTSAPQTQSRIKFRRPSIPLMIAMIVVIAGVIAFIITRVSGSATSLNAPTTAVTRGSLIDGISATGRIEPRSEAGLVFNTRDGRISNILVQEGDTVVTGAPLVELEQRQKIVEVAAAQAALAEANADLQALNVGATSEQIAAARAQVAAAQGALLQIQGSVTSSDIVAARAQVDEARAQLTSLTGSPNRDSATRAQTALTQAQANLDRQRSSLSATKEQARQNVELAANRVRDAQAAFASARDNLASVESDGNDPLTGADLSDAGERAYRDAYANAERAMQDAESTLTQARIAYEDAKAKEITSIAEAEAQLRSAQTDLNTLNTPNSETVAAARAQLASAEATLARLVGDQRTGALAAQQANLAQAQANLDQLLADPRSTDLARAQARVAQAQANVDLALIRLDETTLRAPFDGTVARINVTMGEDLSQNAPITLIDMSRVQVKVTVDEVDVSRVQVGQQVDVLIDALGLPKLAGTVKRIAAIAQVGSEVIAYEVVVEVDPGTRTIKPGMTASATIITSQRTNALSIPASAIRTEQDSHVVTVITTNADGKPQSTTRTIQIGATFGDRVEVMSGLNEGEQILTGI